jgi:hypothetical protein
MYQIQKYLNIHLYIFNLRKKSIYIFHLRVPHFTPRHVMCFRRLWYTCYICYGLIVE